VHKADKPDLVSDLPDADILAGEYRAEVDLAVSDADTATLGDPDGPVVEGIIGYHGRLVFVH